MKPSQAKRCLWNRSRASFTLVELLVVIAIIAVLSSLIAAAVMSAIPATREAAIIMEIQNLSTALQSYKSNFGEYPPDFTDPAAVERHCRRRFPRIISGELTTIRNLGLTPDQALVFWLRGFSGDVQYPHTGQGSRTPLHDFDATRVVDRATGTLVPLYNTGAIPSYLPSHGGRSDAGATRPFIYFRGPYSATGCVVPGGTNVSGAYRAQATVGAMSMAALTGNAPESYVNYDSFQLISAGLDGDYGQIDTNPPTADYPAGQYYVKGDRDNLVNFSRRNLDDSKP